MLDQLRAVDRRDQEGSLRARRALPVVHRAIELPLQNGPVNFAQLRGGGFVLHANHDAVRMEEIQYGGPLSQKLGVGRDPELNRRVPPVSRERSPSMSVQITSCPASARHAPVTRPT